MGRQEILDEARKLSADEQIALAEEIKLNAEELAAAELEMTVVEYRSLMLEIKDHKENPNNTTPWSVINEKLKAKYG